MKKIIVLFVIQILLFLRSTYPYAGVTANDFLNFYPGARSYALGENDFADTTDAFSLYYNPAVATFLDRKFISLQHTEWFAKIRYEYLGYFAPELKFRGRKYKDVGLSYMLVYLTVDRTYVNFDYYINKTDIYPYEKSGRYLATFHQLLLTKGYRLNGFNIGVNAKILFSRIDKYNSIDAVFDIGTLWDTSKSREIIKMRERWKKIVIPEKTGFIVRSIGPKTYFVNERYADPQPTEFILAFSNHFFRDKLFYTFNLRYRVYYGMILSQGIEYNIFRALDVRLGYRHKFYENRQKWYNDFNFGLGLNLNIGDKASLHLDYSLKSFYLLGLTHYISTYLKF